jgi:hypothetical protein
MKKMIMISLLVLAAYDASGKCENSRVIRIRLNGCTPPGKFLPVVIGGVDVDVPIKSANVFEGPADGLTVNPTFKLVIPDQPLCCVPTGKMAKDACVVEYIAACDKRSPGWTLSAASNESDIEFDFDFEHPLGADRSCPARATRKKNMVQDLGERDVVKLTVRRGKQTAVAFPVLPEDLAKGTLRRKYLETKLDEMARLAVEQHAPNSGDLIKEQKKLLPDSITLTKK